MFLTFQGISTSIVLILFLIYNPKHCYASLYNKLYKVFVCAGTTGSYIAVLRE